MSASRILPLVLRACEETVLKDFLPFFMQSETFFERAMAISVGSLSPTINWKTLAQQEFDIPPKDEQRRIADILWAADDMKFATEEAKISTQKAFVLSCQQLTSGPSDTSQDEWQTLLLSECAEILDHRRRPLNQEERASIQGNIPYYGANGPIDFINDFIFNEEIVLIGEDGDHFLKWNLWPQAYLVNNKSWVNNHAHVFRAKSYCSNSWLYRFFQHRNILSFLQDSASMSRCKLTKASFLSVPVHIPSHEDQARILGVLDQLELAYQNAVLHVNKCNTLQKEILNSFLG